MIGISFLYEGEDVQRAGPRLRQGNRFQLHQRLALQFGMEGLFAIGSIVPVAVWIDERFTIPIPGPRQLSHQAKIAAMRTQKYVAPQPLQHVKTTFEAGGNVRIGEVSHSVRVFIHVRAAHDHHVHRSHAVFLVKSPGLDAAGMAGAQVSGQRPVA
jgi:hypothetical protein